MKRFGSISPFVEQGGAERRIGRLVANHDFIKALIRYGSFDEYVLANPSNENQRSFLDVVDGWGLDAATRARIAPVPLVDLPARMARDAFHVFHAGGWGAFLPGLHRLRAAHAPRPWPITGMIFSIHGREMLDYAVRLSHAGLTAADAIACLSHNGLDAFGRLLDAGAAIAGRRYAGRLVPLGLGVDDDVLDVAGDREAGRRRLQIPADAVALLVLGRITPAQKMDLAPLLKVFARRVIPEAARPVVLVIAGGASDGDVRLLQSLLDAYGIRAQTRVHANFLARVKPDLLAAADILVSVVDNTQETFGLSILEALGHGRPVVASRFDGYKDLVDDGVDGLLVDTLWCEADPLAGLSDVMDPNVAQLIQAQSVAIDTAQLADHLRALIADEPRRLAMGAAGRAKVRERFRASAVVRQYEALWDELAAAAAALDDWRTPAPVEPAASRTAIDPAILSPSSIFRAYPTDFLSPNDTVATVPGVAIDPPYADVAVLLDRRLLGAIRDRCVTPTQVRDVVSLAAIETRGWFAVMWLLKYGVLRVAAHG
ncbi:MAG: glycosyltransferase family 4 protein [Vicinamibacteraceae bacterium]